MKKPNVGPDLHLDWYVRFCTGDKVGTLRFDAVVHGVSRSVPVPMMQIEDRSYPGANHVFELILQ